MPEPGLTLTQQEPASAVATIDLGDETVTDCWRALFAQQGVRDAFIRAVRTVATGASVGELYTALDDRDVPHWLHSRIRDVARGDRREAWRLVAEIVPTLGHGRSTVDDIHATAGLFGALAGSDRAADGTGDLDENEQGSSPTPTLAVALDDAFRDRRRDQREDLCELLAQLSTGFDVRVIGTGRLLRWLATEHREDLPGVSEWCNTGLQDGPVDELVATALDQLDPDGRPVATLRALADEPAGTLPYSAVYAQFEVSEARVRQCLGQLQELGLISSYGGQTGKYVDLLAAGRETLSEIDRVYGRQETFEDSRENWTNGVPGTPPETEQTSESVAETGRVSETGQIRSQCRVNARAHEGPPSAEGSRYSSSWMDRSSHVGAVAAGSAADVAVVEGPLPGGDDATDRHVRLLSYNEARDEAVLAVRATGACQYVVSVATALATPWFIDEVLPPERLGKLDELPEMSRARLRDARCIGALSDDALDDPEILRDALVDWGTELQDLTSDLHNGDYEDRDRLRSAVLRTAHGLAGTIVHILDVLGVDLVQEVRVPDGLAFENDLQPLAKSIGIAAAIQSRYGTYAVYRQLFEDREDKRQAAKTPRIDAADPVGDLIPSIVVRGPDVSRLRPLLEERLSAPVDVHDDAPEFAVSATVAEPGREAVATAVTRILDRKLLDSTRAAVTLCHALVRTPHDVARALFHLGTDEYPHEIRADELRYALGTLDPECILPDAPPTVAAVITALLQATAPLSQQDLADRADVAPRSIRRHQEILEAVDIVRSTDDGYRLAVSFRDAEERSSPVLPTPVTDENRFHEAIDEILLATLSVERYADPDDPVGGALFWPRDCWRLVDDPEYEPWVQLAARLTATAPPDRSAIVTMGPAIEQTALQETAP